jgi:hypothetical protein
MSRRSLRYVAVAAALVGASAVAVVLLTDAKGGQAAGPSSRSARMSSRGVAPGGCDLSRFRITRAAQLPAGNLAGQGSDISSFRFVNEGPTCTIGGRFPLVLTEPTTTHVALHARLAEPLRLVTRQAVTLGFDTYWRLDHCRWGHFTSIVFHGTGNSKTVSLGRHPHAFDVCTPLVSPPSLLGCSADPS